ncbi:MAG: hypothetical protein KGJ61_10540, partial [Candidatus Omnitrophica bacterium]|nr:hypothetical protein [Candidatus Omnitrophota bacterium]
GLREDSPMNFPKNQRQHPNWPQMHGIRGILKSGSFGFFLYPSHESVAQYYFNAYAQSDRLNIGIRVYTIR